MEGVTPQVDGGSFPVKRVAGDALQVEADIFADGHDALGAHLLHCEAGASGWRRTAMDFVENDRWRGRFRLSSPGRHLYTVEAWVDPFRTWRRNLAKWISGGADVSVELEIGARLLEEAAQRARNETEGGPVDQEGAVDRAGDPRRLDEWAKRLRGWADRQDLADDPSPLADAEDGPLADALRDLMARYPDRTLATRYPRQLAVQVDRVRAGFSAWYEFFPRSTAAEPGRHGTLQDARRMVPYVREMGFDVVYLPPIHPVGEVNRKGPNNRPTAQAGDPGSPWAIGSEAGGHTAIHPELGTLEDFRALRRDVEAQGMELALDIAFQCAPDHPWVREHPDWFVQRPDGSIRHAENPPKKYEDIYPLNFETPDWQALWEALKGVFDHWMDEGVRIFRVDNPHTKPFPFWDWVIEELRARDPGVILLSEAFTRPKVMYRLAKGGFHQSYTYFAWRHTREELEAYLTELTTTEVAEYFRPNFWPNTPDILTETLQTGGRPAFMLRLALAATLSSNYGIYGPAFELLEHQPREPGSEEYLDSEKYQVRHWDLDRPDSLQRFIGRVNAIRRDNPAFQQNATLRFHPVDNPLLIAYSKVSIDGANRILTVVNLDPRHTQSGWVHLDLEVVGLRGDAPFQAHDLLADDRHLWHGARNYVELNPTMSPAHILLLRERARSEEDFEYF